MDALTRGLKKVTLKLGTREEHDRKMKEKLDSDRRARALRGAETRRINKAARDAELSKSKLTPAQRAKLGPDASRVAETSRSRLVPAQQAQPVPGAVGAVETNAIPTVDTTTSHIAPAAAPSLPTVPKVSNEMPGTSPATGSEQPSFPQLLQQHLDYYDDSVEQKYVGTMEGLLDEPRLEGQHTAAVNPPQSTHGTQPGPSSAAIPEAVPEPPAAAAPHFDFPTYTAPPLAAVPAPTTAPAPAPAPLPFQPPTTNTFFNPSYAPQQPQQPPTHSRQSSSGSLYRFVPVMDDTTPPSSRPSSSACGASYQPSPVGSAQKSGPDVADRQLPVFSATGRIPFASSGPADAGAAAPQVVGGGSRLKSEMDVDGDVENGWEVPETPEK